MGICFSTPSARDSAANVQRDRAISKTLRTEAAKDVRIKRLLLLGAGESGKSTIFKQLKILHCSGFTSEERVWYSYVVHSNIVDALSTIVAAAAAHIRLTGDVPILVSSSHNRIGKLKAERLLIRGFSELEQKQFQTAVETFTHAIVETETANLQTAQTTPSPTTTTEARTTRATTTSTEMARMSTTTTTTTTATTPSLSPRRIVANVANSRESVRMIVHLMFLGRAVARNELRFHFLALQDATAALELSPTNTLALVQKGIALAGLERFEHSLEAFRAARQNEPKNEQIQKYLDQLQLLWEAAEKLPEGWKKEIDAHETVYFINTKTNIATYQRPVVPTIQHLQLEVLPTSTPEEVSRLQKQPFMLKVPSALELENGDVESIVGEWERVIDECNRLREESNRCAFLTRTVSTQLSQIWSHQTIKQVFAERNTHHLQVIDTITNFMEHIDRIGHPNYLPSDNDIVLCRQQTTGVTEMRFCVKSIEFRIVDVGGQRSERRKWLQLFGGVDAVIFVAAINEYNQVLLEDTRRNRLQEALDLFEMVANSRYLRSVPLILFLNKRDLFVEKLARVDLSTMFPSYTGGDNFTAACQFLSEQFLDRFTGNQQLFVHVTCATDGNNIEFVFDAVKDIIIMQNLAASHF